MEILSKPLKYPLFLTAHIATQAWQMKACKAPVRDAGPMSRQINIALLVIATICISIRFVARWRIRGSVIGWDDWTILGSYILLIPSTAILQISSSPDRQHSRTLLTSRVK